MVCRLATALWAVVINLRTDSKVSKQIIVFSYIWDFIFSWDKCIMCRFSGGMHRAVIIHSTQRKIGSCLYKTFVSPLLPGRNTPAPQARVIRVITFWQCQLKVNGRSVCRGKAPSGGTAAKHGRTGTPVTVSPLHYRLCQEGQNCFYSWKPRWFCHARISEWDLKDPPAPKPALCSSGRTEYHSYLSLLIFIFNSWFLFACLLFWREATLFLLWHLYKLCTGRHHFWWQFSFCLLPEGTMFSRDRLLGLQWMRMGESKWQINERGFVMPAHFSQVFCWFDCRIYFVVFLEWCQV